MAEGREATGSVAATNLRASFVGGLSPAAAERFLTARAEGLGWEAATQALAAGLRQHYGQVDPALSATPGRQALTLRLFLVSLGCYAVLRPTIGLGHELVVALLASLIHVVVGSGLWEPLIRFLHLDPIYTGAAIRAAGGVQVTGFSVANPLGDVLHSRWPAIFVDPAGLTAGAAISMVAAPGAPAIGRALAAFGADVVWLAVGIWLFWTWRRSDWRVALVGLFIQGQIAINHLGQATISLADLDASGVPFALALAVPSGGWITTGLADMSSAARGAIVGGTLITLAYVAALALLLVGLGVLGVLRIGRCRPAGVAEPSRRPRWGALVASISLAFGTALSPIGALARGESNWQATAALTLPDAATGKIRGQGHALRLAGATPVDIAPGPIDGWTYTVDGVAETIRGVGYNPQYASLPASDRAALYRRDFEAMHQLGINTIEGWFETQFDGVTLDSAARSGIGVMMPFELNQDWDFTDPAVRAGILDRLSAYVERYKNHPAVRMWTPGNENLHRILYAHWVSQENVPLAQARAGAFAAFLPQLVDRIHDLDPNHPVVYRDAEDVYLHWITSAFSQSGGGDRPWLVYGANVYSTSRLQQIIAQWPSQWPGRALLISEFAPGGVGPAERPLGFQQQWSAIESRSNVVLGGLAYTWATNGPEDLDRVFGLVDANGIPTDDALAALSGAYLTGAGTVADAPPAG